VIAATADTARGHPGVSVRCWRPWGL